MSGGACALCGAFQDDDAECCDCEAARGEPDSPNFAPQELRDFEARGYERRNRRG